MVAEAGKVLDAIAALAPINGVQIVDAANRATWVVDFKPEATAAQRTAVANAITAYDVAAADQADRDSADVQRQLGKALFNHENRLRVLEGRAAVTMAQFVAAVKAL